MNTEKGQDTESASTAHVSPCRWNKSEKANWKNHVEGFVHASMDEHKACFKHTLDKVIDRSRRVFERKKADPDQTSALPR